MRNAENRERLAEILNQGLMATVKRCKEANRNLLRRWEASYKQRKEERWLAGIPTLAIVGAGQAGKDEVADLLEARYGLEYVGSCSKTFAWMIAECLDQDEDKAYFERRKNRKYWFDWLTCYRHGDPAGVARAQLAKSDFCVGIRGEEELRACCESGVVDIPIWVNRPGYDKGAHEITPELVKELGGRVLDNTGTLYDLETNVEALAAELGLEVFSNNRIYTRCHCGEENSQEVSQEEGNQEEGSQEEGSGSSGQPCEEEKEGGPEGQPQAQGCNDSENFGGSVRQDPQGQTTAVEAENPDVRPDEA
jgi:hypothetical protein